MVFHWSLSDSKCFQVSKTLLSIPVDLNNAVIWIVSTRSLISKSFNPSANPSVTALKATITIGIIVTFMIHSYFNSLVSSRYFTFFFTFFQIYSVVNQDSKVQILQALFLLLIIILSSRLAEIRWSVWISESQRSLCVSFSKTDAKFYIKNLFEYTN